MRLLPGVARPTVPAVLAVVALLLARPASAQQNIEVSVTLEILPGPGVQVVAPSEQEAAAGDTVYYLFRLHNTGSIATAYRLGLTASDQWKAALPQHWNKQAGPLAPGEVEIIAVAVTAPSDAPVGSTGDTTLVATATVRPRPSAEDSVTTTVVSTPNTPRTVTAPPGQHGAPGSTITYGFELMNIGVTEAWFRLRLSSSPPWSAYLPNRPSGRAGPLAPGQIETVLVVVEIPAEAEIGASCDTTLSAIREGRLRVTGEDAVTTLVTAPAALTLGLLAAGAGDAYIVRLTNGSAATQRARLVGTTLSGAPAFVAGGKDAEVLLPPGTACEVPLAVERHTDPEGQDYLIVHAEVLPGPPLRLSAAALVRWGRMPG